MESRLVAHIRCAILYKNEKNCRFNMNTSSVLSQITLLCKFMVPTGQLLSSRYCTECFQLIYLPVIDRKNFIRICFLFFGHGHGPLAFGIWNPIWTLLQPESENAGHSSRSCWGLTSMLQKCTRTVTMTFVLACRYLYLQSRQDSFSPLQPSQ